MPGTNGSPIVQARMSSPPLSGKALKQIISARPMQATEIERLEQCQSLD